MAAGNSTDRFGFKDSANKLRKAFAEDYQITPQKVVLQAKQLENRKSTTGLIQRLPSINNS
jgi:hypothetical protein